MAAMLHSPLERKNVLVIGGAGFLGSVLCEKLIDGANVICLDNFSTGSQKNIRGLFHHPSFECINRDITQPLHLADLPELRRFGVASRGIDEVYHLACPVSSRVFRHDQTAAALTASLGTKHVFDLALRHGSKVCFGSSSAVYGVPEDADVSVSEQTPSRFDHLEDFGAFIEGLRFTEAFSAALARTKGVEVKIARVFPTYGERECSHGGGFVAEAIAAALRGDEIIIPGDERSRASFAYVADVADGLIRLMDHPVGFSVVNIGSPESAKLGDVADLIIRTVGSNSRVRYDASAPMLQFLPIPDLSRARELLGWSPRMPFEEGLKRTIESHRVLAH